MSIKEINIINLGEVDWNLFQRQRITLIRLSSDPRLSNTERSHLRGVLNLTDHIIDTFRHRRSVPRLEDVVLDLIVESVDADGNV